MGNRFRDRRLRRISYIKRHGQGRTYAGLPTNWGMTFTVGAVPVFKYLESQDVDEIGYTLRTASLMTDPEYLFHQSNPSDFILFGVRYLILPVGMPPPVFASSVMQRGSFLLGRSSRTGTSVPSRPSAWWRPTGLI